MCLPATLAHGPHWRHSSYKIMRCAGIAVQMHDHALATAGGKREGRRAKEGSYWSSSHPRIPHTGAIDQHSISILPPAVLVPARPAIPFPPWSCAAPAARPASGSGKTSLESAHRTRSVCTFELGSFHSQIAHLLSLSLLWYLKSACESSSCFTHSLGITASSMFVFTLQNCD